MSVDIEGKLQKILGGSYGGPSLSVDGEGNFILYTWCDAPVCTDTIAKGKTLKELLKDYDLLVPK